ncbi:MAG: hypothetical protein FJ215_11315 [Ignavibacteria bacterium]|nr:hypothetical protein [Ignavibacteria bacterium]
MRYRRLTLVSGPEPYCAELIPLLEDKLTAEAVSELKFEEVRGHAPKMRTAGHFLEQTVAYCCRNKLRVDVLLWDNYDSRHAISHRDDEANLVRMYYKNLLHVARRWGAVQWRFLPDEQSGVEWNELRNFLNNTRLEKPAQRGMSLFPKSNPFLEFEPIVSQNSVLHSLIQTADLFGGLSRFSHEKGREYLKWIGSEEAKEQPGLFLLDDNTEVGDSKADRVRFSLLRKLDGLCKQSKLGVSLRTWSALSTPNPNNPINFWNYVPQHEMDKAPTKSG